MIHGVIPERVCDSGEGRILALTGSAVTASTGVK
jgi:hypothetical protein